MSENVDTGTAMEVSTEIAPLDGDDDVKEEEHQEEPSAAATESVEQPQLKPQGPVVESVATDAGEGEVADDDRKEQKKVPADGGTKEGGDAKDGNGADPEKDTNEGIKCDGDVKATVEAQKVSTASEPPEGGGRGKEGTEQDTDDCGDDSQSERSDDFDPVRTLKGMAESVTNIERRNNSVDKRLNAAVTTGVYVLQGFIQIAQLHKSSTSNPAVHQHADEIIESTGKRLDHLVLVDPAAKEAIEKSAIYMSTSKIAKRQSERGQCGTPLARDRSSGEDEDNEDDGKVGTKEKVEDTLSSASGTREGTEQMMSRADIRASIAEGFMPRKRKRDLSSASEDEWNQLTTKKVKTAKKEKVSSEEKAEMDGAKPNKTKADKVKVSTRKPVGGSKGARAKAPADGSKGGKTNVDDNSAVDKERPSPISFMMVDDDGGTVAVKSDESMVHYSFGNLRAVGILNHPGTVIRLTDEKAAVDLMKSWVSKAVGLVLQDPKLPIGHWANSVESGIKVMVIFVNSVLKQLSDHPSKKTPMPRPIIFTSEVKTDPEKPKEGHSSERPKLILKQQPAALKEILKAALKSTDLEKQSSEFVFAVLNGAMPEIKGAVDSMKTTKKKRSSGNKPKGDLSE